MSGRAERSLFQTMMFRRVGGTLLVMMILFLFFGALLSMMRQHYANTSAPTSRKRCSR